MASLDPEIRCPTCGATVRQSAKFCNKCGTRLSKPVSITPLGIKFKSLSEQILSSPKQGLKYQPTMDFATFFDYVVQQSIQQYSTKELITHAIMQKEDNSLFLSPLIGKHLEEVKYLIQVIMGKYSWKCYITVVALRSVNTLVFDGFVKPEFTQGLPEINAIVFEGVNRAGEYKIAVYNRGVLITNPDQGQIPTVGLASLFQEYAYEIQFLAPGETYYPGMHKHKSRGIP